MWYIVAWLLTKNLFVDIGCFLSIEWKLVTAPMNIIPRSHAPAWERISLDISYGKNCYRTSQNFVF